MKKTNIKTRFLKVFPAFVLLCGIGSVQAQSERFLWEVHSTDIFYSYYDFKEMDSAGNVYMAGTFDSQGMLAGQLICPLDTSGWLRPSKGVFIAKFDTTGTMLWCRSVKDWNGGNGFVNGISIQNNNITFMFEYSCEELFLPWDIYQSNKHCWLHFIDTTYYGFIDGVEQPYGTLPYRNGQFGYLVTFDSDGTRLDTKTMSVVRGGAYSRDSKGNHYILINQKIPRTSETFFELNDDSTQRFYYPVCNNVFYPSFAGYRVTPFLLKINPEWTNVSIFQLSDSLNGYRNVAGDSVFYSGGQSDEIRYMFIDDEDNIYFSAQSSCNRSNFKTSFPLEYKFNNGSSIIQEYDGYINYIMCVDTGGNVRWVRQFFYDKFPSSIGDDYESYMSKHGGVNTDADNLYYVGTFFSVTRFVAGPDSVDVNVYFDRERQDTMFFPDNNFYLTSIVVFDKHTGEYITHLPISTDTIGTIIGYRARPFVNDDYIIINAASNFHYNCTYRYRRQTGEWEKYDTVFSQNIAVNRGVLSCYNGFVCKWIYGDNSSLESSNFNIPANAESIIYYYDSLLDKRRQHRPDDPTSVREVPQPDLVVYPNPTSDIVNVGTTVPMQMLELYDAAGRLVERRGPTGGSSVKTRSALLDLRRHPVGVYLLKVQTEKGLTIRKIVRI